MWTETRGWAIAGRVRRVHPEELRTFFSWRSTLSRQRYWNTWRGRWSRFANHRRAPPQQIGHCFLAIADTAQHLEGMFAHSGRHSRLHLFAPENVQRIVYGAHPRGDLRKHAVLLHLRIAG